MFQNEDRERVAFGVKLAEYEYDSTLFIDNIGSFFWLIALYLLLVILHFSCFCVKRIRHRLAALLFWNGIIRVIMETYMEVSLISVLNISVIDWQTDDSYILASSLFALVFLSLFSSLPLLLLLKLCTSRKRWHFVGFKKRYGTVFEGLMIYDDSSLNRRSALIPLITFFGRRMLFAVILISMRASLWFQLLIQMLISLAISIYFVHFKPCETSSQTKLWAFNEIIILVIVVLLMCFSDAVQDAKTRHQLGYGFIALSVGNIAVNLAFMLAS